jgi:hypothetical protein
MEAGSSSPAPRSGHSSQQHRQIRNLALFCVCWFRLPPKMQQRIDRQLGHRERVSPVHSARVLREPNNTVDCGDTNVRKAPGQFVKIGRWRDGFTVPCAESDCALQPDCRPCRCASEQATTVFRSACKSSAPGWRNRRAQSRLAPRGGKPRPQTSPAHLTLKGRSPPPISHATTFTGGFRAFFSQMFKQLLFQHATRLNEQAAIDRLV